VPRNGKRLKKRYHSNSVETKLRDIKTTQNIFGIVIKRVSLKLKYPDLEPTYKNQIGIQIRSKVKVLQPHLEPDLAFQLHKVSMIAQ